MVHKGVRDSVRLRFLIPIIVVITVQPRRRFSAWNSINREIHGI